MIHSPAHDKTTRPRTVGQVRKRKTYARHLIFLVIAAAFLCGAFLWPFHAAHAATASATPAQKTCAAFKVWDHQRTTAHLDAMMTDSFTTPWKYVGDDASGLYADVRASAAKYVASDIKYMAEDCSS